MKNTVKDMTYRQWTKGKDALIESLKKIGVIAKVTRLGGNKIALTGWELGVEFDAETNEFNIWGKSSKAITENVTIETLIEMRDTLIKWSDENVKELI